MPCLCPCQAEPVSHDTEDQSCSPSELHPSAKVIQGPSWLAARAPPMCSAGQELAMGAEVWPGFPANLGGRLRVYGVGSLRARLGPRSGAGSHGLELACGRVRAQCQPPRLVPCGLPVTVRAAEAAGHPPSAPAPRARARVPPYRRGPQTRAGRGRGMAAGPSADWPLVAGVGAGGQTPALGRWAQDWSRRRAQGWRSGHHPETELGRTRRPRPAPESRVRLRERAREEPAPRNFSSLGERRCSVEWRGLRENLVLPSLGAAFKAPSSHTRAELS